MARGSKVFIDISCDETQEHWDRGRYASWHHRDLDILMWREHLATRST
jgi:hypothetical protein